MPLCLWAVADRLAETLVNITQHATGTELHHFNRCRSVRVCVRACVCVCVRVHVGLQLFSFVIWYVARSGFYII